MTQPVLPCRVTLCSVDATRPMADPLGIPAAFWYYLSRQKSRINPAVKMNDPRDLEDAPHVQVNRSKQSRQLAALIGDHENRGETIDETAI